MRVGDCRHFNGIQNDTCRAGVDYETVKDKTRRPVGLPCLARDSCSSVCPKHEAQTAEDVAAWNREVSESFSRITLVRAAIVKATNKARQVSGRLNPCPACGSGTVHFAVHFNGHIHAKCTTEGCVCWME